MREPNRLLSGGTGLERLLLAAAREERPTADLRRRMQRGIGVAVSLLGVKAAFATVGQVIVVVLLAAGISDSTGSMPNRTDSSASTKLSVVVAPRATRADVSESSPAPNAQPPASAELAPVPDRRAPTKRASGARAGGSNLREEIRLLDRVRESLKQDAPRRALTELALYREHFPRGAFQQEASVLRVEALARSGERARASALAREFVFDHPDSPHRGRVEQVGNSATPRSVASGVKPR